MRSRHFLFLSVLSVFLFGTACTKRSAPKVAAAKNGVGWSACSADKAKYCADVPIGGGRIINCLTENLERLSPECQKAHKKNTELSNG